MSEHGASKHERAPKRRPGTDRNRRGLRSPRRSKRLNITLSEPESEIIRDGSSRSNLSMAAFVARAALAEARGARDPAHAELRAALSELMRVGERVRRLAEALDRASTAPRSDGPAQWPGSCARSCARLVDRLDRLAEEICRRLP
ncbi:plasmid mobilization protein [Actinomadura oligospora]|uniref:plasmid mobilization protein n=1 Tax=Actinomadura oligospora TaxID=111804 RepID=UPI00047EE559|nr:hypothetical protein [Actinomadura oligospora]